MSISCQNSSIMGNRADKYLHGSVKLKREIEVGGLARVIFMVNVS